MEATGNSKPYGVVYCVTQKSTGKVYIGQTTQPLQKRWADHNRAGYCVLLYRALRKHGKDDFHIEPIDQATSKDELDALEAFYIIIYGATNRNLGFNLRAGGSSGKHSEESKQRMSVSVRNAYKNPEFKAKLVAAKVGVKHSADRVAKVVAALTGKTATEEAKNSMSEARKRLWNDPVSSENMRKASVAARANPAYVAGASNRAKAQWENPALRQKMLEAAAAGKAAFWADPVKKAARIEKRRATIAAKAAAQI